MDRREIISERQVGLPTNDQDHEVRQADLATAVAARVFGDTSIRLPFALAVNVEMQANMERQLDGMENFILVTPKENHSLRRAQRERDDDDLRDLTRLVEEIERQREREEWARTTSSFGNVQMTGAEWQAFGQEMREDGPLRRWLLDRIRRDGKTEEEARVMADRVADVAEIMGIPPGQRTAVQRQRLEAAQRDPTLSRYVEAAAHHRQGADHGRERDRAVRTGDTRSSTTARADQLASFGTAPPIRVHHAQAQQPPAAGTPARSPAAQPPTPAPSPAASGFDN